MHGLLHKCAPSIQGSCPLPANACPKSDRTFQAYIRIKRQAGRLLHNTSRPASTRSRCRTPYSGLEIAAAVVASAACVGLILSSLQRSQSDEVDLVMGVMAWSVRSAAYASRAHQLTRKAVQSLSERASWFHQSAARPRRQLATSLRPMPAACAVRCCQHSRAVRASAST